MQIVVNGERVPSRFYEQELMSKQRSNPGAKEGELKDRAAQSVVERLLIKQEANRRGYEVLEKAIDKAYEKLMHSHGGERAFFQQMRLTRDDIPGVRKDLEQNVRTQMFLDDLTRDVKEPLEEAIESEFGRNPLTKPEEIHAAHIVKQPNRENPKQTYDEMMEIRQKLLDGADFGELADQHSSCHDPGGDLGFFSRGKMVEEFEVVVFSMNPGEVSPIFVTQFGYHVAKVYEKRPESLESLEEARGRVRNKLLYDAKNDLIGEWVDAEKEKATIEIRETKAKKKKYRRKKQ